MTFSEVPEIEEIQIPENGGIPNHPALSTVLYRQVLRAPEGAADAFEARFKRNRWQGIWRWGVHPFHHFHSTAHEVLGVASGSACLRIGGPDGVKAEVRAGDMIVLPAGTGHQCVRHSADFEVVGAYPPDQDADLLKAGEDLAAARRRIAKVPLPEADPFFGSEGPLLNRWESS